MRLKLKVVGPYEVGGHKPGQTFTADWGAFQVETLVQAGHVEVLSGEPAPDVPAPRGTPRKKPAKTTAEE